MNNEIILHTFYIYETGERYTYRRASFARSFEATLKRLNLKYHYEEHCYEAC